MLLTTLAATAFADDFEDGVAAYVKQQYAVAIAKFKLAAAQGHAGAQFVSGLMYTDGQGVAQDYVLSHMWYNLAASGGFADAVEYRDLVAARMTTQQIAEAQMRARECLGNDYRGCD